MVIPGRTEQFEKAPPPMLVTPFPIVTFERKQLKNALFPMFLTLSGRLIFMKNHDVPGVIGYVGTVLGENRINIANFSLGRRDAPSKPGEPLEAVALVEIDEPLTENVQAQLLRNPAVKLARAVEFPA